MGSKMVLGWVAPVLFGAAALAAEPVAQPGAKPEPAVLRVEWHRTMAALVEAQSAKKPDPARIAQLSAKLQELRAQAVQSGVVPMGLGPRGGMGWGAGRCWSHGGGWGMGYGRMGAGPGPCGGRGAAWGPGFGRGAGWGAAAGWGRAFVDANQNGICDNYERLHPGP